MLYIPRLELLTSGIETGSHIMQMQSISQVFEFLYAVHGKFIVCATFHSSILKPNRMHKP